MTTKTKTTLDRITAILNSAREGNIEDVIIALEQDIRCAGCLNDVDRKSTKIIRSHIGCQHSFHGECFNAVIRLTAVATATARTSPSYKTVSRPRIPCRVCNPNSIVDLCNKIDESSETTATDSRTLVEGILEGKTPLPTTLPKGGKKNKKQPVATTEDNDDGEESDKENIKTPTPIRKRRMLIVKEEPSAVTTKIHHKSDDDDDDFERDSDLDSYTTEFGRTRKIPPHKICDECRKRCKPGLKACWSCGNPF